MQFYVGVTDPDWFSFHQTHQSEEVNFWRPGGKSEFQALTPGAPFLFKLRQPYNHIAGVAFYVTQSLLPLSIAWKTFETKNGSADFSRFRSKILSIRRDHEKDPVIGCLVLTDPVYFERQDWIDMGGLWKPSIVQGKTYSDSDHEGRWLWNRVEELSRGTLMQRPDAKVNQLTSREPAIGYNPNPGYSLIMRKVRLGQAGFRTLIMNAYNKRCAMTGEKTLPALEAAHIKEYTQSGPHLVSNGLLLRADIHNLFDAGYITVTEQHKIEVSRSIKEKFENGKEYYRLHGQNLLVLPGEIRDQPDAKFITWHNENVYQR